MTSSSELEDILTLGEMIQAFLQKLSRTLQRSEPKMLGKKGEIGLAHHSYKLWKHMRTQRRNHAKKGHLIKPCHFTFKSLMHNPRSHIRQ